MIGRIRGVLIEKQAPVLLVAVGGICYEVFAPLPTFYKLPDVGKEIELYTHFVVREDGQFLYGFYSKEERELFRLLIKVSGIGPKLALTILSGVDADGFVHCIKSNDIKSLVSLPGIGKKTAERLMIEMRDYLKDWEQAYEISTSTEFNAEMKDAISALISLGYKPQDAQRALMQYKDQNLSTTELIRTVLKNRG